MTETPTPDAQRDEDPNADRDAVAAPALRGRRLVLQIAGFVLGLALIVWCVRTAAQGDGWSRLRDADPLLIAALLGCTLVSLMLNGAVFWLSARPLRRMPLARLQAINLVAALLNYAPVRLGFVARVAFHVRVDRIGVLDLACWFGAMTIVLGTVLMATAVATVIRPQPDLLWLLLFAAQIGAMTLVLRVGLGLPLLEPLRKRLPRLAPLVTDPVAWWGSVALRTADLAAFTARMAIAATILGLSLGVGDLMLLAVTALVFGMSPLGRLGFREAGVAFVAARLSGGLDSMDVDAAFAGLALLESVGEAIVAIPLGILALPWFWRRMAAGAGHARRSHSPA